MRILHHAFNLSIILEIHLILFELENIWSIEYLIISCAEFEVNSIAGESNEAHEAHDEVRRESRPRRLNGGKKRPISAFSKKMATSPTRPREPYLYHTLVGARFPTRKRMPGVF